MISRYTRPEMGRIWEAENRYAKWLQVEIAACEAMAAEGLIPEAAVKNTRKRAAFSVERIREIEAETRHDVIAFLTNLEENVGPDSRFIHLGLTSSDVLDTSFALLLKEAMERIIAGAGAFAAVLREKAMEHRYTVTIGRSHGIHAEPTTFGIKLAGHYAEFKRGRERMAVARDEIATCAISGAVGTFGNIDPFVEDTSARKWD